MCQVLCWVLHTGEQKRGVEREWALVSKTCVLIQTQPFTNLVTLDSGLTEPPWTSLISSLHRDGVGVK